MQHIWEENWKKPNLPCTLTEVMPRTMYSEHI
jgi:hypothetical protein